MSDDLTARFNQAVQYRINGEYDAAIPILHGIVATNPNHADTYHELGLIHTYRVDMDESIEFLEKAIALSPSNVKYLVDLGKAHTMFGDFDKAAPVFSRALSIDPFNDEASKQLEYLRNF